MFSLKAQLFSPPSPENVIFKSNSGLKGMVDSRLCIHLSKSLLEEFEQNMLSIREMQQSHLTLTQHISSQNKEINLFAPQFHVRP